MSDSAVLHLIDRCQVILGGCGTAHAKVASLPSLEPHISRLESNPAQQVVVGFVLLQIAVRLACSVSPPADHSPSEVQRLTSWWSRFASAAAGLVPLPPGDCGRLLFEAVVALLQERIGPPEQSMCQCGKITQSRLGDSRMQAALELMARRYTDPALNLRIVAHHVGMSPSRLSRLFTSQMKVGFAGQLQGMRMETAGRLLCTTPLRVKEVASSCGCKHVSDFDRLFRRHFGMTPGEWRVTHRAD